MMRTVTRVLPCNRGGRWGDLPIPETESEAAKSHRTTKKGVGIQLKEKKILEYSSKICLFPLSLPSFIIGVVSCIYALPPLKSLHSPTHTHEHMVRMIIEIKTWGTSFVDLHPVPAPAHQNALPVGATAASPISRNEPRMSGLGGAYSTLNHS